MRGTAKIGRPDAAVVAFGIGRIDRDLLPGAAGGQQFDRAAEAVGVGKQQSAQSAVELDRRVAMPATSKLVVTCTMAPETKRMMPATLSTGPGKLTSAGT